MKRDGSRRSRRARQAHGFEKNILKILSLVILTFIIAFPRSTGDVTIAALNDFDTPEKLSYPSVGSPENLQHILLPGSFPVEPARTLDTNGFAYVNLDAEFVLFSDLFSEMSYNMSVGSVSSLYSTLIVEDVDDDGHDEFIGLKKPTSITVTPFIVDFNDDTLTEWSFQGVGGDLLGVGDFNGDTQLDIAMTVDWSTPGDWMHTIDLSTGSIIGTFDLSSRLRSYGAIGKFSDSTSDQVVMSNDTNIWVVNGNGSCNLNMTHTTPIGIQKLDYGGGLSDIVILDNLGFLTLYQGSNLAQIYQNTVGPPASQLYAETGNFTGDAQEDIVVTSTSLRVAQFINGTNGDIFRETPDVYATSQTLATGKIDSDMLTDVVLISEPENPCFIHGSNSEIAYIETLVEPTDSIRVYDFDGNGREDIFINSDTDLYILKSERDAPEITQVPLDPLHPTIVDDFITVEVNVFETSSVESAELNYRMESNPEWMQPQSDMLTPDGGNTYFAFLVGLEAATYEYYVAIRDVYLNTGYLGNDTHPFVFEVTGHFAWQHNKSETYQEDLSHNLIALGNLSDSTPLIYSLELDPAGDTVYLNKCNTNGSLVDSYSINYTAGLDFWIASGMFDGDSVLDPVAIVSADVSTKVYVLHGNNFTLYHSSTSPLFNKRLRRIEVLDGDGDGRDDLYQLKAREHFSLARMDSGGTWSWRDLTDPDDNGLQPQFMIGAVSGIGKSSNLTIIRGNTFIEIVDGSDINLYSAISIPTAGFDHIEAKSITTLVRSSGSEEEFALGITFWSGPTPETRLYLFDGAAQNIGDLDTYILADKDVSFLSPYDVDLDGIDELVVLHETGELSLTRVNGPLSIDWTIHVTDSTPLSGFATDFNGWPVDEFLLFTKEDGLLTVIFDDGEVRTAEVGEVYVPIPIGDIDLGKGQEIAAYPVVVDVGRVVMGAIRDLDAFYRLDVVLDYSPTIVDQGRELGVNVTVSNIYGESIEDATVYLNVHFILPEGQGTNTYTLNYNPVSSHYDTTQEVLWSIGVANLSVFVDHNFYHGRFKLVRDAFIVRSNLSVSVFGPELAIQGRNMTVQVWVFDNLGTAVSGAEVNVSIGGSEYPAIEVNHSYFLDIVGIQVQAGEHHISATATHQFGNGIGFGELYFDVQTHTKSLNVTTDFPGIVRQYDNVTAVFVINDAYGQEVVGATVTLRSGETIFELEESLTPGSYVFNSTMQMKIGNHSFEVYVSKLGVFGPPAIEISVEIFGNLEPNVFYETRVEGGSIFEVSVYIKDNFGPVFLGTSVTIEINGTRYTQIHATGESDYAFMVLADFRMGQNTFTVYVNATYADPWSHVFFIRAFSDATADSSIQALRGNTISQGEQKTMELTLVDWLHRPVSGATVIFYVKALSYTMQEGNPGVYTAQVTTSGWAPGEYDYSVLIDHDDIETGEGIEGTLIVTGRLEFDVTFSPDEGTQNQPLEVLIAVQDIYGNPIPDLEVFVALMDMSPILAGQTDVIGTYEAIIELIPETMGYGLLNVSISAQGEFVEADGMMATVQILAAVPDFTMSVETISLGAGLSFLLSLFGMFVYFRISSSTRIEEESLEGLQRSVRRMDRIYLLMVVASGAGLVSSYWYYYEGALGLALILTIALLGGSVILYGLWLYRDAVSAVLIEGALSRRRMVLGLWHLVFVPVVIAMILSYGIGIAWFKAYIIDPPFALGSFTIPAIVTTIFVAYVSSIIVVVVNLYREVSKGIMKIGKMEESGTPRNIIEDEKLTMINRFSSSIRIKFLMFLVVVGATTVMSMEWLQSFQLAVIVLMPVLFLVVIPFLSSKILQVLGRVSESVTGRRAASVG
ncbi:MAG: hypothetical protein ACXABF_03575 [Candidatus Thorarchaeota archaeon]|jgi:hypothetical protein